MILPAAQPAMSPTTIHQMNPCAIQGLLFKRAQFYSQMRIYENLRGESQPGQVVDANFFLRRLDATPKCGRGKKPGFTTEGTGEHGGLALLDSVKRKNHPEDATEQAWLQIPLPRAVPCPCYCSAWLEAESARPPML